MSDDILTDGKRGRLYRALSYMAKHGSSVVLNYGEDTGQWECSWIVEGHRYVGVKGDPEDALDVAYYLALAAVNLPEPS